MSVKLTDADVTKIADKIPQNFAIIDIIADNGDNTLKFLNNSKIKQIISFTDKTNRQILKDKVKNNSKCIVEESRFNYQDFDENKGAVMFISVNNYDLTEILKKYREYIYMFVIAGTPTGPDKVKLDKLHKTLKLVKDGELSFIIHNDYLVNEEGNNIFGIPDSFVEKNSDQIKWTEFCSRMKSSPPTWTLKSYQAYVKAVLTHITTGVNKVELIDRMVGPEYIDIWIEAITHNSVDLNANYERLETYGDNLLGYSISQFLRKKFPDIPSQGLTEYKSRYMSHEFQGKFTEQMKLSSYILIDEAHKNEKIKEDVFESFSGAILTIANSIQEGLGPIFVLNFLTLVLSDTIFDKKWYLGKPITQIQQRSVMLKIIKKEEYFVPENDEDDNNDNDEEDEGTKKKSMNGGIYDISIKNKDTETYTVTIIVSPPFIEYIKVHLYRNVSRELVSVTKKTKKEASDLAWYEAYVMLESIGFTDEFAKTQVEKHVFDGLNVELVTKAKEKSKNEGYIHFTFSKAANAPETILTSGINDKGIKVKLSIARDKNINVAKEMALQNYVNGKIVKLQIK